MVQPSITQQQTEFKNEKILKFLTRRCAAQPAYAGLFWIKPYWT